MSGDNGIEVSRDGRFIFVAAWGNKELVRLSRDGKERSALRAGFLADGGSETYGYDGDGQRMQKVLANETTYSFYAIGSFHHRD
jgi:hypothetical protein